MQAFSSCGEWGLLLLRSRGSRPAGFSSCGAWAWLLRGIWDLPGPGLEPVSPALAGGFLTIVSPAKPNPRLLKQSAWTIKLIHYDEKNLIAYSDIYLGQPLSF